MRKVIRIPSTIAMLLILLGFYKCSPGIPLARRTFSGQAAGIAQRDPGWDDNFPGLAGFMMDFNDDDDQILQIMAGFFQDNQALPMIRIAYSDQNGDDFFSWTVDGIELPPGTTLHEERGTANYEFNQALTGRGFEGVPVLTGFGFFTLNSGDHNIDKILVRLWRDQLSQLELSLAYQDKDGGGDIKYEYIVDYAVVPADQVRATGTLSGSDGDGSDSVTFGANLPVLQGFELNYKVDDHELDQIGVRLAPGTANISYNDKNDDDDFNWKIYWVDLSSR